MQILCFISAEHKYEIPEYEEEYEPKRKIQKLDHVSRICRGVTRMGKILRTPCILAKTLKIFSSKI